jgi:hypothetical protein
MSKAEAIILIAVPQASPRTPGRNNIGVESTG